MQTPMEKLEQAKEMLDKGLIEKADFDDIKKQCLIEMGMRTPSKSHPEESSHASSFLSEKRALDGGLK